jgi:hypothetical protein
MITNDFFNFQSSLENSTSSAVFVFHSSDIGVSSIIVIGATSE